MAETPKQATLRVLHDVLRALDQQVSIVKSEGIEWAGDGYICARVDAFEERIDRARGSIEDFISTVRRAKP